MCISRVNVQNYIQQLCHQRRVCRESVETRASGQCGLMRWAAIWPQQSHTNTHLHLIVLCILLNRILVLLNTRWKTCAVDSKIIFDPHLLRVRIFLTIKLVPNEVRFGYVAVIGSSCYLTAIVGSVANVYCNITLLF